MRISDWSSDVRSSDRSSRKLHVVVGEGLDEDQGSDAAEVADRLPIGEDERLDTQLGKPDQGEEAAVTHGCVEGSGRVQLPDNQRAGEILGARFLYGLPVRSASKSTDLVSQTHCPHNAVFDR